MWEHITDQTTAEVLFLQTTSTVWEATVLDAHILRRCPFWLRYLSAHPTSCTVDSHRWSLLSSLQRAWESPSSNILRIRHYLFSNWCTQTVLAWNPTQAFPWLEPTCPPAAQGQDQSERKGHVLPLPPVTSLWVISAAKATQTTLQSQVIIFPDL